MSWQPIETAPKTGRPIELGWKPNGPLEYSVTTKGWDGHGWTDHSGGYFIDATHWKPVRPTCTTGDAR